MLNHPVQATGPETPGSKIPADVIDVIDAIDAIDAIDVAAEVAVTTPVAVGEEARGEDVAGEQTPDEAVVRAVSESEPPAPPTPGFPDLGLRDEVRQAVIRSGYHTPTAIQSEIIPHMLDGRDVLAQSQTGTGKTAAFALPILSGIEIRRGQPQVLVLAPTRELAIQVASSFETYAASLPGFNVAAIYGGQSYDGQFRKLKQGVQVVVGTPGRVIDHIRRGTLDLTGIRCLVLDEADEMLNMGFLDDVRFVLEQTPAERQIALFSATLPGPIREIAQQYLNEPVKVTIRKKTMTAESIRQRALFVAPREKIGTLIRILEAEETDGVIVFTKTKDATVSVAEKLTRAGLSAVALNGDMPQRTRERTIERLKAGHLNVLVATDVAARGLDVSRVSHVFNFDLPHDSQSYIHRIGRTGRAGRKGEALIFLTRSQRGKLKMIERATRQTIEVVQPPSADTINKMRIRRFGERIAAQIANPGSQTELAMFQEMIAGFAEQHDQPLETVAAALACAAQQGRPFLMKERSPAPDRDREPRDEGRFADRKERRGKGQRERKKSGPPAPGMVRYRIQVGWRDGVKPGNIVGAVANEAGIDGEYIGPIEINHGYSLIDLPEGMPGEVFRTLQRTWVAGRQLKISVDGERPERRKQARSSSPATPSSGRTTAAGQHQPVPGGKAKRGPGGKGSAKKGPGQSKPGKPKFGKSKSGKRKKRKAHA